MLKTSPSSIAPPSGPYGPCAAGIPVNFSVNGVTKHLNQSPVEVLNPLGKMAPGDSEHAGREEVRFSRPTAAVFSVLVLCAPLSALPPEDLRWIQVETEHFTLYSSASEDRTLDIAGTLEDFRAALYRLLPDAEERLERPTPVYVFGSESTYRPYDLRTPSGEPGGSGGFCSDSPLGYHIAINATPGYVYRPVIYHEYVHRVFFQRYSGLPLWVHGGLAEYFSTLASGDGQIRVGYAPTLHLEWLRANPAPMARWLFTVDAASPDYGEKQKAGGYYAGSWLLIHYLLHDAGGKPMSLERLLALRSAERPFNRSLLEALETIDVALDTKLGTYGTRRSFSFDTLEFDQTRVAGDWKSTPLNREIALTRLGELQALVHEDYDAAQAHFRSALAIAPDLVDAAIGLSYSMELGGQHDQAATWFSKARELAPQDPRIYLMRGQSVLKAFEGDRDEPIQLGSETDSRVALAREMLRKGTELDPELPEAHAGLGVTYIYEPGDVTPGIAALERACRMEPGRPDFAGNLAILYARVGAYEKSAALVLAIEQSSGDLGLVRHTRRSVMMAKHKRVWDLANGGKLREAISMLAQMVEETQDPQYRQVLADELRRLRHYERYNQAVALARAGRVDEARDLLLELQHEVKDPEIAGYVREMLEQIDSGRDHAHRP
jgi:tetratricopeptide (TPR) repeat protein